MNSLFFSSSQCFYYGTLRVHTTIVIDDHLSLSHAHLYRDKDGVYFIPFTPTNWLPLFQLCDGYDAVCRWFDYLKAQGYFPVGFWL